MWIRYGKTATRWDIFGVFRTNTLNIPTANNFDSKSAGSSHGLSEEFSLFSFPHGLMKQPLLFWAAPQTSCFHVLLIGLHHDLLRLFSSSFKPLHHFRYLYRETRRKSWPNKGELWEYLWSFHQWTYSIHCRMVEKKADHEMWKNVWCLLPKIEYADIIEPYWIYDLIKYKGHQRISENGKYAIYDICIQSEHLARSSFSICEFLTQAWIQESPMKDCQMWSFQAFGHFLTKHIRSFWGEAARNAKAFQLAFHRKIMGPLTN